ncbi:restriction endonuclease subunit S [Methylobacterium sp. sgz302541]|uniref:restriction endonuclease subunit S n=1 Tax=unclassified Methylobacterium TaxID=2615210 RepID=UPI003D33834F
MPEARVRQFAVSELFNVFRGNSKYIKTYYREHPGPYPVYSASADPSLVHGTVDGYDFDGRYLTWTTNGYAGFTFVREGGSLPPATSGCSSPRRSLRSASTLGSSRRS